MSARRIFITGKFPKIPTSSVVMLRRQCSDRREGFVYCQYHQLKSNVSSVGPVCQRGTNGLRFKRQTLLSISAVHRPLYFDFYYTQGCALRHMCTVEKFEHTLFKYFIQISVLLCLVYTLLSKNPGGATALGKPCIFPFTYKGTTYKQCTGDAHTTLWCSTTSLYNKQWGNCQPIGTVRNLQKYYFTIFFVHVFYLACFTKLYCVHV